MKLTVRQLRRLLKETSSLNDVESSAIDELRQYIQGTLAGLSDSSVRALQNLAKREHLIQIPKQEYLYRGMTFMKTPEGTERYHSFCDSVGIPPDQNDGMAKINYEPIQNTSSWTTSNTVSNSFAGIDKTPRKHQAYWSVLLTAYQSDNAGKFISGLYDVVDSDLSDFLEENEVLGVGTIRCRVEWVYVPEDSIPHIWEY